MIKNVHTLVFVEWEHLFWRLDQLPKTETLWITGEGFFLQTGCITCRPTKNCLHTVHTTTTILRPFVWVYPGEPVPEETLTHPPSWSSSDLYQLLPSSTIRSILLVQITCLAIFLHHLFPCPLCSTSWSGALHLIFHTFLHPISVFCLRTEGKWVHWHATREHHLLVSFVHNPSTDSSWNPQPIISECFLMPVSCDLRLCCLRKRFVKLILCWLVEVGAG